MKQENKQPLVSILMPVHNPGEFLVEAVKSIRDQSYRNWELICIDDGSSDGSFKTLKAFEKKDKRIKVLKNRGKRGISFSLNKALKVARGEYVARMDADDVSLENRLDKQVRWLEKRSDLVACGGQVEMINVEGRVEASKQFPVDFGECREMIMRSMPVQHASMMIRAKMLEGFRYDEKVKTAEDVELVFYLLSKGEISNVDEAVYQYRKVDSSNGYHNIKETFFVTLFSRFKAIFKYGYRPSLSGVMVSVGQLLVISMLPSKWLLKIFEVLRYQDFRERFLSIFKVKWSTSRALTR